MTKELTIYEKLLEAVEKLPKEAVERASKELTRKGYDTTGYQYQYLINVMNEVVGLSKWGFDYKIIKEVSGTWGEKGKGFNEVTAEVTVWLMDGETRAERKCIGGHKAELHADAYKGAVTNGLKKTLAFFGVGKRAYEGTIDEDYRPLPEAPKKGTAKVVDTTNYGYCNFCHAPKVKSPKTGKIYCGAMCWLKKGEKPRATAATDRFDEALLVDEVPFPASEDIPVINV